MSLKLQQLAAGETGGGLGVNPAEEEGGVRGAKAERGGEERRAGDQKGRRKQESGVPHAGKGLQGPGGRRR